MTYTIKQLSKVAGVSVRALHYYDEIGLLKPAFMGENGYRHYGEKELLRLQQIMFFRELKFPLEEIGRILSNPEFDINKALNDQKKMLEIEGERIEKLIKTLDRTMKNLKKEKDSTLPKLSGASEELFEGFDREKLEEYQREAKERWGHTNAYRQSTKRVKSWTKEDIVKVQKEWDAIARAYTENIKSGYDSPETQAVVKTHWDQINKFYDCTAEIFTGLANMYVEDARFAANYRKYHNDLPEFIKKAVTYWCENKK